MNPSEYTAAVLVTESDDFAAIRNRLSSDQAIRLMHSIMGVSNEAGELMEILKKGIFYGKDPDVPHLIEEYGDLLWYIALGLDAIGVSFEQVMERNIAKLKARYSDRFTAQEAIERNKDHEYVAMEKRTK